MTTRMPVAQALSQVLGLPVRIEAYDGSASGPADAEVGITINSSKALSHMVSAPGELGMARAYVSGELDITAPDHFTVLQLVARQKIGDLTWKQRLEVLKALGPEVLQWEQVPLPPPAPAPAPNGRRQWRRRWRQPARSACRAAGTAGCCPTWRRP